MQVQFLGEEDPPEEGMAIHSSILAWRISQTEEPGELQSIGLQRVRHGWSNGVLTHVYSNTIKSIFHKHFHNFLMLFPLPRKTLFHLRSLCEFQARILEWVALSPCRESSRCKDWTHVSFVPCTVRWILYHCTTWEAPDILPTPH